MYVSHVNDFADTISAPMFVVVVIPVCVVIYDSSLYGVLVALPPETVAANQVTFQ